MEYLSSGISVVAFFLLVISLKHAVKARKAGEVMPPTLKKSTNYSDVAFILYIVALMCERAFG